MSSTARKQSALTGEVLAQLREVRRLAIAISEKHPELALELAVAIETALERASSGDVLRTMRRGLADGLDRAEVSSASEGG